MWSYLERFQISKHHTSSCDASVFTSVSIARLGGRIFSAAYTLASCPSVFYSIDDTHLFTLHQSKACNLDTINTPLQRYRLSPGCPCDKPMSPCMNIKGPVHPCLNRVCLQLLGRRGSCLQSFLNRVPHGDVPFLGIAQSIRHKLSSNKIYGPNAINTPVNVLLSYNVA